MLKYRLIFGPIMIVALLGVVYLDDQLDQIDISHTFWQTLFLGRTYLPAGVLILLLGLAISSAGVREVAKIIRAKHIACDGFMVWLAAMVGLVLMYIVPYRLNSQPTMAIFGTAMAGLFSLSLVRYVWQKRTEGALVASSVVLFSFVYLGVLIGFYMAIRRWESAWLVAAIVLVIKSADIGAYATGRLVGRRKLIPWLSPGKTWEGLVGGTALAVVVATALAWVANELGWAGHWTTVGGERTYLNDPYSLPWAAVAGLLLAVSGQLGDLVASVFKRDAGIKDSGGSVPGFGGLLDVIDSLVLAGPVAYWLLLAADRLPS